MNKLKKLNIRLAMRVEGRMWNAYVCEQDSMKDAMLIGSIAMGAVRDNPVREAAFKSLMVESMADAIQLVTGERPVMQEGPAPEHERAGNA